MATFAVPASPYPFTAVQPDGTSITLQRYGDEHFSFTTTVNGYLVEQDTNGVYRYAVMSADGTVRTLNTPVTQHSDSLAHSPWQQQASTLEDIRLLQIASPRPHHLPAIKTRRAPSQAEYHGLVILVNFSDVGFVTPEARQQFDSQLNQPAYSDFDATGSARDFFIEMSDGQFQPKFDVYGPYTLSRQMSYYGANSGRGSDMRPDRMIVDACTAADGDIDFSQYDENGDGYVDCVFVFYAGYSEAAGGEENTIWPHRWTVRNSPVYDGVEVFDYACSSELAGYQGTTMDGIGIFCHEFTHVLGFPDLYNTAEGGSVLGSWDIMDQGCYLNNGRTPAAYSAYERFFMGWLTPVELTTPNIYTLPPLSTERKTFLISQDGKHNLNGKSPESTEFFLLENRQNTGWDSYLPGHGMLVSRINYDASNWVNNLVNNDKEAMGVVIIHADGFASLTSSSLAGDPFPGTTGMDMFDPVSRSGIDYLKPLSHITEESETIVFNFMNYVTPGSQEQMIYVISLDDVWRVIVPEGDYDITLSDARGQIVAHYRTTSPLELPTSSFTCGLYLIRIKDLLSEKTYIRKALKY
jgi:M6 family metalloprotease-like protein